MTSATQERTVPEWVNETPSDGYELHMWTDGDGVVQDIALTREEYITCKATIAGLRGYRLPATGDEDRTEYEKVIRNLRSALENAINSELTFKSKECHGEPLEGEPPAKLVEYCLENRFVKDMADFASNLLTARIAWRYHRELVEAEKFPEDLRLAYVSEYHDEPNETALAGDDIFQSGHRESLREEAYKCAQAWMKSGIARKVLAEIHAGAQKA